MNPHLILLLNLASTWYMVGLIWLIQIVHYPLFSQVGSGDFAQYERNHSNWITPVVGIPMAVELLTAALLCFNSPNSLPRWVATVGLCMVVGVWLSTALLQVPCHSRLATGFDEASHRFLVSSNWIRTALWTARGVLMGYAVWLSIKA